MGRSSYSRPMNTYQVWLPSWREFDAVVYGTTTDRMAVIAQLRQHEGRARYVTVWDGTERRGHMMFRPGQIVTLEDFG